MRLLVYGGNQYNERRRIGVWPESISEQVLQDSSGASIKYAAFGVGIFDEQPFLILRLIRLYNQRSYPMTVLLDPGADAWEQFAWNGADLLLSLFGGPDAPGQSLLKEPESYHSAEHLKRLFEGLEPKAATLATGADVASELFLSVWCGAILEESPVVVWPDERIVGFSARPSFQEMTLLLEELPVSLRCGSGWLLGGNAGHAVSFGVRFIFDDGRSGDAASGEEQALLAAGERGRGLFSLLRAAEEQVSASKRSELGGLLSCPSFLWGRNLAHPPASIAEDLRLLIDLTATDDAPRIVKADEIDAQFKRINERLGRVGPLTGAINAAAKAQIDLAVQLQKLITRQQAFFVYQCALSSGDKKIKDDVGSRISDEDSSEFFTSRAHYPSEAAGLMPAAIKTRVCQALFKSEPKPERLPEILAREAHADSGRDLDMEMLVPLAVSCSASSDGGLRVWRPYLDDKIIGDVVTRCVRSETRARLTQSGAGTIAPESVLDYINFGGDPGGEWLTDIVADDPSVLLDGLVELLLEESRPGAEDRTEGKGREWLMSLAKTDLRQFVSYAHKLQIAPLLEGDWAGLNQLLDAFKGLPTKGAPVATDAEERQRLSLELKDSARQQGDKSTNFVPDIGRLRALLSPEHLGAIVDALHDFRPCLSQARGVDWVSNWEQLCGELEGEHKSRACDTFQAECRRYLLEGSYGPPLPAGYVSLLTQDSLIDFFNELLYDGGEKQDRPRRERLLHFLRAYKNHGAAREALRESYRAAGADESRRVTFLGRYAKGKREHPLLEKWIGDSFKDDIDWWNQRVRDESVERCVRSLEGILTSGPGGECHARLLEAKSDAEAYCKVRADVDCKQVFGEAIEQTFKLLIEDQEKVQHFCATCASDVKALKLIRDHLSEDDRAKLDKLLKANAQSRKFEDLKNSLFEGTSDTDEAARKRLSKVLSEPDWSDDDLERAVAAGLSKPELTEAMFRRFTSRQIKSVQTGKKGKKGKAPGEHVGGGFYVHGEVRLLFDHLSRDSGIRFVTALFEHYGQKPVEDNPVVIEAHKVFKKLKKAQENGEASAYEARAFDFALLCFTSVNPSVKNQVAIWEFGEKQHEIESYLNKYCLGESDLAAGESKGDDSSARSFKLWIRELPGKLLGRDRHREDNDQ